MPEIVNPETHHERSDVNVRALLWFTAIFIVFAAASHFVLWFMFKSFASMARHTTSTPLTALTRPADASIPRQPRLQPFPNRDQRGAMMPPNVTTPVVDMEDMRATEEHLLRNPGWVDRQKGIVRLPIEVAKQLAVQQLNVAPALSRREPAGEPVPRPSETKP
jgi:hypothetical protein